MKVMVATDGSEAATHAARVAVALLHPDAAIELVTVIPERYDPEDDAGGFEGPVVTEKEADEAWTAAVAAGKAALAATDAALPAGTEATEATVPTDQSPGPAIVQIAKEHQVDLLVLGARQPGFLHRLLSSSASDHVIHHAPCPVLIVPPADPPAEA